MDRAHTQCSLVASNDVKDSRVRGGRLAKYLEKVEFFPVRASTQLSKGKEGPKAAVYFASSCITCFFERRR